MVPCFMIKEDEILWRAYYDTPDEDMPNAEVTYPDLRSFCSINLSINLAQGSRDATQADGWPDLMVCCSQALSIVFVTNSGNA